jgi:hypothetical protein
MPSPDQQDKSVAEAAILAAAAFAIALVLTIFFAWHQGAEVPHDATDAAPGQASTR